MRLIIKNGCLIDGRGNCLPETDIVVIEGKFARIGHNCAGARQAEDILVDASGKWVVPGLIDCHVHITKGNALSDDSRWSRSAGVDNEVEDGFWELTAPAARDALLGAHHAAATLRAGFTTVRDLGGARGYADIVLREAIRTDRVSGPRLLACGGGLAMTGGHWWNVGLLEIDGKTEARRATRRQLKAGANVIKIMASRAGSAERCPGGAELSVEEMRQICEEAHNQGIRVSAHAVGAESIRNAVLAGADTIEHGCFCDDESLQMMKERAIFLITTLYAYHQQAGRSSELGWPEHVAQRSQQIMDVYPQTIRRALELGVPIAPGSDTGQAFLTPHGENAAELVLLSELVGLDPGSVLTLATYEAARALGMEDRIGSIEEGKLADFLIVNRDPLLDISVLRQPDALYAVIKEGVINWNDALIRS